MADIVTSPTPQPDRSTNTRTTGPGMPGGGEVKVLGPGPGSTEDAFVTVDTTQFQGGGIPGKPLQLIGGGGGNRQAFVYVANGGEGAVFNVPFPAARTTTNYAVLVMGNGLEKFLVFDAPQAGFALDHFQLTCSAAPSNGDKIAIIVQDLT